VFKFKETERHYRKRATFFYYNIQRLPQLRIHCKLLLKKPDSRKETICKKIEQLRVDSTYSDVTISTGWASYPSHKAILASKHQPPDIAIATLSMEGIQKAGLLIFFNLFSVRSPVFHAMFDSMMSEANENRLDLSIFSEGAVRGMLEYIYTGKTEITTDNLPEWWRIADMYQLDELKADVEWATARNLTVENAIEAFQLSILFNANGLKKKVISFIMGYYC